MEGHFSQFPPNFVPLNVPEAEAGVYRHQLSFLKANKVSAEKEALSDYHSYRPSGREILYARSLAGDLNYVKEKIDFILENENVISSSDLKLQLTTNIDKVLERDHTSF